MSARVPGRRRASVPPTMRAGAPGRALSRAAGRGLAGLRILLHGQRSTSALARALDAHRGLVERGAELVVIAGPSEADPCARRAVVARCPWARAVDPGSALAPSGDGRGPQYVLVLSADVECDRAAVEELVRFQRAAPPGLALTPALRGPSGCQLESTGHDSPPAWMARCRDLVGVARLRAEPCPKVLFTVTRDGRVGGLRRSHASSAAIQRAAAATPALQRVGRAPGAGPEPGA